MTGKTKEDEIFLPVKESGREVSVLEVINEIKEEAELKRTVKRKLKAGKHRGCRRLKEDELKTLKFTDIDMAGTIRTGELMVKRYRYRRKTSVLFVVDGSRSQGSAERLSFAKSAVLAILEKAYTERARAGLILFGDKKAELVLPYTRSLDFAALKMRELKAKGNTSLAMALRLALKTANQDILKNEDDIHIVVVLTDGKCNYDNSQDKPLKAALKEASELKQDNIYTLVIDTESGAFSMGLSEKLAASAGSRYVSL